MWLRRPALRITLALLLAMGAASRVAVAQDGGDAAAVIDRATKLLEAGDAAGACDLVAPALSAHDGDLVLHFLYGQCLDGMGYPRKAIAQYQLVLARDPNAIRARAELAQTDIEIGDNRAARAEFEIVLARQLPDDVRRSLQAMLDGIPGEGQKEWSASASAGVMYDSNVNVGPWANSVILFGAPFPIVNASHATGAWAALATGSVGIAHPLTDTLGIAGSVGVNAVRYTKLTRFDFDSYSLSAGPTVQTGRYSAAVKLGADIGRLGDALYSASWGLAPEITVPLNDVLIVREQVSVQLNRYITAPATDGWSGSAATSLQWYYGASGSYLQPQLNLAHQEARTAALSNDSIGGSVNVFQPLGREFSLLISPGVNESFYRGQDPSTITTRHDTAWTLTANLGYDLGFYGSQLALGYDVTGNRSNQPLYKYNRQKLTLQFKVAL